MKKALMISLLFFSLTATANSQTMTDRERAGLKGPVQTVRLRISTTLDENGQVTETPLLLSQATTYDKSGNKTEVALYDKSGILSRRIVSSYEPKSKKRIGLITYDSNNSMVRKVVDLYGKNGLEKNQTIEVFNEDGTLHRKTEVTFDSVGNMTEVAEYRIDGTLIKREHPPFKEPKRENIPKTEKRPSEEVDYVVSSGGSGRGEYFEPDPHGN